MHGSHSRHRPRRIGFSIVGSVALCAALTMVLLGLKKGGFLTTTDVGGLEAFGAVQAQLMPLNVCEMRHSLRDKRGNRTHRDAIFASPCVAARDYESVVIRVPQRNVHYEMRRSAQSDRFEILVEKDDVVFQDLVAALNEHAAIMVATYQKELDEWRGLDAAYQRGVDAQKNAERERKDRAKDSFPGR